MGDGGHRRVGIRSVVLSFPTRANGTGIAGPWPSVLAHTSLGSWLCLSDGREVFLRPLPRYGYIRPGFATATVGRTPPIGTDQLCRAVSVQCDPRADREHQRPCYLRSWQLAHRILVDGRIDCGAGAFAWVVGRTEEKSSCARYPEPAKRARRAPLLTLVLYPQRCILAVIMFFQPATWTAMVTFLPTLWL